MLKAQQELAKFRWLLILLVPALAISLNFIMFGKEYVTRPRILIFSSLILLVGTALLSLAQITVANFMRRRQTADRNLVPRMLLAACLHFPLTALFVSGFFLLYSALPLFGYHFNLADYGWG
ncbi:MAG TPA: hypothetical protein VK166_01795, partial [Chitinophagaceae bacterium]|nr:hypothetical protein [Chitinophagaceae bacterium]